MFELRTIATPSKITTTGTSSEKTNKLSPSQVSAKAVTPPVGALRAPISTTFNGNETDLGDVADKIFGDALWALRTYLEGRAKDLKDGRYKTPAELNFYSVKYIARLNTFKTSNWTDSDQNTGRYSSRSFERSRTRTELGRSPSSELRPGKRRKNLAKSETATATAETRTLPLAPIPAAINTCKEKQEKTNVGGKVAEQAATSSTSAPISSSGTESPSAPASTEKLQQEVQMTELLSNVKAEDDAPAQSLADSTDGPNEDSEEEDGKAVDQPALSNKETDVVGDPSKPEAET
ncbi:hypothetical protein BKA65DRAFT_483418 [Rhexocercosporidium sp. MPI-PUGE-AT-0058]|nr:hypothetical protein BKA65DRAFT_483418 [Rhexocercosporidium sp. MPI-PUGE-AT-0058]